MKRSKASRQDTQENYEELRKDPLAKVAHWFIWVLALLFAIGVLWFFIIGNANARVFKLSRSVGAAFFSRCSVPRSRNCREIPPAISGQMRPGASSHSLVIRSVGTSFVLMEEGLVSSDDE